MWSKPRTVVGLSREYSGTKSSIAIFHGSHVVRLDSSSVLTWSFGVCADRTRCICLYRTALSLLMEGKNWSSFDLDFWVTIYPCAISFPKQTLQLCSNQSETNQQESQVESLCNKKDLMTKRWKEQWEAHLNTVSSTKKTPAHNGELGQQ